MKPSRSNLVKSHYAQQSRDAGLWACPKDTSTLSVFVWPDNSDSVSVHDVGITPYESHDSAYVVLAPGGLNWNTAPRGVSGGTVTTPARLCPPDGCPSSGNRFVYFAFTAGRKGSGRPFPYIRVEKIDRDTMDRAFELDIWNPEFAFAMPALNSPVLSPLGPDEVAISLATGGGGNYADNAVGRGVGYSTLGYEVKTGKSGQTCAVAGCNIKLHYVLFGRESALFPPPIIVPK